MIDEKGREIKVELKGICKTCKHWGKTGSSFYELKETIPYYINKERAIKSFKDRLRDGSSSDSEFCSNEKNQVITKHVNWALFVAGGIPTTSTKHEPIKTDKNWYCPLWEPRKPEELRMRVGDWMEIKYPNKKFKSKYSDVWSYKTEEEFDEIIKNSELKDKGFFG